MRWAEREERSGRDKVALITGVTGQDGAYLAEFLLGRGYIVHGVKRRASSFNTGRIENLYQDLHAEAPKFFLHYGDLTDATNIMRIVQETQPDEIYNLGAQSHVQVSFETPEYTANVDALGTLRLLEAIRILGPASKTGSIRPRPRSSTAGARRRRRRETTPFSPRSPYAAAKLYAYWITVNYREAYGMHASNGILFNHESPMRGETFVTRKITRAAAAIQARSSGEALSRQPRRRARLGPCPRLCQGHVADAAAGPARRLRAGDRRRRTACATSSNALSRRSASGSPGRRGRATRRASMRRTGRDAIAIDPRYFRPTEVDLLVGDAGKARARIGWRHETGNRGPHRRNGRRGRGALFRDPMHAGDGLNAWRRIEHGLQSNLIGRCHPRESASALK